MRESGEWTEREEKEGGGVVGMHQAKNGRKREREEVQGKPGTPVDRISANNFHSNRLVLCGGGGGGGDGTLMMVVVVVWCWKSCSGTKRSVDHINME